MFTGIIQEIGTIKTVTPRDELIELEIRSVLKPNPGGSIAIDGACLSATDVLENGFKVEAIPETVSKTIIKNYQPGTPVNLEPALTAGDPLDGHFVSGHVDFTSTVSFVRKQKNSRDLTITIPIDKHKFFPLKGSISINGVSLTISDRTENSLTVSLIPETLKKTNLGDLQKNDTVNIEIDLLSRYLDSLLYENRNQHTGQS